MVVEPERRSRPGSAAIDASDAVDARERRELAILGARIGAVDAGEVRRQRQRDRRQKERDSSRSARER